MFIHYFSLSLLIFLLSACGYIPIESEVPDQLPGLRAQVTPGETSRQQVHERLGKPFISDERLGIELYRVASGRDAEVQLAPVPVRVDTEEVIIMDGGRSRRYLRLELRVPYFVLRFLSSCRSF